MSGIGCSSEVHGRSSSRILSSGSGIRRARYNFAVVRQSLGFPEWLRFHRRARAPRIHNGGHAIAGRTMPDLVPVGHGSSRETIKPRTYLGACEPGAYLLLHRGCAGTASTRFRVRPALMSRSLLPSLMHQFFPDRLCTYLDVSRTRSRAIATPSVYSEPRHTYPCPSTPRPTREPRTAGIPTKSALSR